MKYLIFIGVVIIAFVGGDAFFNWRRSRKPTRRDCIWTNWVKKNCIISEHGAFKRLETRFKIPARNGGRDCVGDYTQMIKPCSYAELFAQKFIKTFSQGRIANGGVQGLFRSGGSDDAPDYVCSEPITDPQNRWRMSGRACKASPKKRRKKRFKVPENLSPSARQTRDVLFLIDESGSVGPQNFKKILNFVTLMISKLCDNINIGPNQTKVALTTFDSKIHDHLNFNDHTVSTSVIAKIDQIRYTSNTAGSTCLVEALKHARKKVFTAKHGARKSDDVYGMVVLITDGCANCQGNLQEEVQALRDEDITFMIVTIADKHSCAQTISNLVNADHCYLNYEMSSWDDFQDFVKAIRDHNECQSLWNVPDETCSAATTPTVKNIP